MSQLTSIMSVFIDRIFRREPGAILVGLLALSGCTTTLIPPEHPQHPTEILISDYGRHSSILLPDGDVGMVEYAFGDWNWYALGRTNVFTAIGALIHSPQSTLGRRSILIDPDGPDVASTIGASRVERVIVDGDRVSALRARLDGEFARHIDREVFNQTEHIHFVPCDDTYWMFHNCNHATAEWLKELGVKVRGAAIFSRFEVKPAGE